MNSRREFIKSLVVGGSVALLTRPSFAGALFAPYSAGDPGWSQVPAILQRIKPPIFPKRDFDIVRYGASGDGKADCSNALREAISACSKAGGGRVVVPAGTFLTGPIHLQSNVNT